MMFDIVQFIQQMKIFQFVLGLFAHNHSAGSMADLSILIMEPCPTRFPLYWFS